MINGVRKGHAGYNPIKANTVFVPAPYHSLWNSLNAEQQVRVVASGIYHADGTINRETAARLGWDAGWESA